MAEDLAEFEQWMGRIINSLEPGKRRHTTLKLGQDLRRANLMRIAANVEPDGSPMEKRKASRNERGRLRRKAGTKMFRRLRMAKAWKINADADGVEITPASAGIDKVAATHQFGEIGYVGRLRNGRVIRTKYPERPLLDFADTDRALIMETAASLLDPDV